MQQGCAHSLVIQVQFCEDLGHMQGMDDIGLPGNTGLSLMGGLRQFVSPLDEVNICMGLVLLDSGNDALYGHGFLPFVIHPCSLLSAVPPEGR